jgi:hypothetical protein
VKEVVPDEGMSVAPDSKVPFAAVYALEQHIQFRTEWETSNSSLDVGQEWARQRECAKEALLIN